MSKVVSSTWFLAAIIAMIWAGNPRLFDQKLNNRIPKAGTESLELLVADSETR
jgi:hypothetical protein